MRSCAIVLLAILAGCARDEVTSSRDGPPRGSVAPVEAPAATVATARVDGPAPVAPTVPAVPAAPTAAAAPVASDGADAAPTAAGTASARDAAAKGALPGRVDGCPDGMVRVVGDYCPAVVQHCLEHHPEWIRNRGKPGVAERCLRYREPSTCLAPRRPLDFCMDRYEYPNVPGELPRVLVDWHEAGELCRAQGKRLCTEHEFNFACEGPDMLPYVYGAVRNARICNQDRDYVVPDHSRRMKHFDECREDAWCASELARLDRREPIGSRPGCVSWAGVFDLNGNANEWVVRIDSAAPYRGGLKGGWWGPIRSRCRPMTTFHPEHDYGYEVGFRCCADSSR